MTRFILVTFFFLAVAFYEMSGGAGFVPEQRVAAADPVETVTRADTVELAALTVVQEPAVIETLAVPLIEPPVAADGSAQVDTVVESIVAEVAQTPAVVQDLRQVTAERVNMREGPGTDYAVMDRLIQGTEAEVLETDAAGWARVRVLETGLSGWVSAEFLGTING